MIQYLLPTVSRLLQLLVLSVVVANLRQASGCASLSAQSLASRGVAGRRSPAGHAKKSDPENGVEGVRLVVAATGSHRRLLPTAWKLWAST